MIELVEAFMLCFLGNTNYNRCDGGKQMLIVLVMLHMGEGYFHFVSSRGKVYRIKICFDVGLCFIQQTHCAFDDLLA